MENNKKVINVKVNGFDREILVKTNQTLLNALREDMGLTGVKEGCGKGECGACTVIMDGKSILSCMTLAVEADGKEITTIEGLATNGELHPLQKSFAEKGAIQCGFCTPGMIMTAKALLDKNPHPTREEIKHGINGNICRCTGYVKIIDAIEAVANGD
ncbi:MAG: (2Fe-2S)-binding protein [Dehalococcoidales bacterium]|jgi:carbon-monoxide dehydrogenase small subunit|nr:(2Fe-2S)-binding protein [Dehalococcoidales bacterium]